MDIKELITTLGLDPEKIKTVEDFKTNVDSTFTRNTLINEESEPVKKILGKTLFGIESHVRKAAKEFGVEVDFNSDSVKSMGLTDKLKLVVSEVENKNKSIIQDLESKVGLGNDDKVKEWEKKYEKVAQKSKDLQALLDSTKNEYQQYQEQASNQIKGVKLDVLKKDAFGKVKFKNDISEFEKKGYFSTINENYLLDIDENESLVIKDKKGSLIPSTKVTGSFKTVAEILEEEAVKGKLYALNPDGGKAKPGQLNFGAKQQQTPQKPGRQVAPRLG